MIPLQNNFNIFLSRPDQQTPLYEFIRKSKLDGYDVLLQWHTDDVNSMTTSKATINIAQQLGLQYLRMVNEASPDGINRYGNYYNSLAGISNYDYAYGYFGNGSELVAMWQAFAQHLGHTIANQVFGYAEYSVVLQGKTWVLDSVPVGSNLFLEASLFLELSLMKIPTQQLQTHRPLLMAHYTS